MTGKHNDKTRNTAFISVLADKHLALSLLLMLFTAGCAESKLSTTPQIQNSNLTLETIPQVSNRTANYSEEKRETAQPMTSTQLRMIDKYVLLIRDKISRNWLRPPGSGSNLSCLVEVQVAQNGDVVEAQIRRSSGHIAFDRSVEAAVFKASPLPLPPDPKVAKQFHSLIFGFSPSSPEIAQQAESQYKIPKPEVHAHKPDEPTDTKKAPQIRPKGIGTSTEMITDIDSALVKAIQKRLKLIGYDPGQIDGVPGASTVSAVKHFQKDAKLQINGKLTKELLGQLDLVISFASQVPKDSILEGSGSGFFVNDKGYILTNYHVVEGCNGIKVIQDDSSIEAEVYATDEHNDLALLKLPAAKKSAAYFSTSNGLTLGERVMTAGFPLRGLVGSSLNVTTGIVSSVTGPANDKRIVQISAPVQPGNSGGPVLDSSGNVVGVVVAKFDVLKVVQMTGNIPENVGFGIKGLLAKTFLNLQGVDYRSADSTAQVGETHIAKSAEEFTVAVECWK